MFAVGSVVRCFDGLSVVVQDCAALPFKSLQPAVLSPLTDMPLSLPAVYPFSCLSLSITLVLRVQLTLLTFVCRSCLLDRASLVTFALVNILCQTKTA